MHHLYAVAIAIVLVSACGATPTRSRSTIEYEPETRSIVVVSYPTTQFSSQLAQLKKVITESALPGQVIVVMVASEDPASTTYIVKPGDHLDLIARRFGTDLTTIESLNPQLGPIAGRNFSLIHPGNVVFIPGPHPSMRPLLVTKAPPGPPRPSLIRLGPLHSDATDFQRAQHRKDEAAADAANRAAIAAWETDAAKVIHPWVEDVLRQIDDLRENEGVKTMRGDLRPSALSTAIRQGVTTLRGLDGKKVLVLLESGMADPQAISLASMDGVDLVVANLVADTGDAWQKAGTSAGATVITLDPALTDLRLATVVNSKTQIGEK